MLTQKLITLRETSLQKIREIGLLHDAVGQPLPLSQQFPLSYQQQGRIHILSIVVGALINLVDGMLPAQVQKTVQPLLEELTERKTAGLIFFQQPSRSYHLSTAWKIRGELEQIDEIWSLLCACFSPRWQALPWKHGCHFQVYHYQAECASDGEAIARWQSEQRASWFGEVAIIKTVPFESMGKRLGEVFWLTNHIERDWTRSDAVLWSQAGVSPRPISQCDVIVSVLSGRAWLVDRVGFLPL